MSQYSHARWSRPSLTRSGNTYTASTRTRSSDENENWAAIPGRRSSLRAPLLVFAQTSCAAAAILEHRASGPGNGGGDSDSDSDSDTSSESCSNGVCTVCNRGVCTTSTQGSKPTSLSASGSGNATKTTAVKTSSTGMNTAHSSGVTTGPPRLSNDAAANKGLSKGGIAGLVVGLAIVAGMLAMMLLKWRAHRRHLRQRPRGSTLPLLNPQPPSNAESLHSDPDGSASGWEMTESGFNRPVVASAASVIAAANLAAIPRNGYPAPQPYKPPNDAAGRSPSPTTDILPFAQSKAGPSGRQDAPLPEIHTHATDTGRLSELSLLPSPHEQASFEPIDAANASSSGTANRQSRALPDVPPSTVHAEMVAFQKELEREDEKTGRPGGRGNAEDPPPGYSA
ncbi:hypothetical protein LshimejAT787_1901590 [Lyophyllum shimeji]|uniref:Uncharacterized protein n=1 Tax=Lyophyllum shimeji TaxID=47721 RepID=A0A9P3Q0L5_LYOSH|nr:hypothetical protein LshimejAT787_1901590 [Lyophyllum shimeji]